MAAEIENLQQVAQQAFAAHVEEGLALHPSAKPSHLCIRSKTNADFAKLGAMAMQLGMVIMREHNSRAMWWIKLRLPLEHKTHKIEWLELPAPKPEQDYETGPQMLVFALNNPANTIGGDVSQPQKSPSLSPSPSRPDFTLRFQQHSAEALTA